MWFSRKKNSIPLSKEENSWIESNYVWLVETFGLVSLKKSPLIFISETHFPTLYADETLSIDGCLADLKKQFQLTQVDIKLIVQNLSTDNEYPLQLSQKTNPNGNSYKITVHELSGEVDEIIFQLAIILCKIKLLEEDIDLEKETSSDLFLFLSLVFFGFGDFLTQKIFGQKNGIFINEEINKPVAARIISLYLKLKNLKPEPDWFSPIKKELSAPEDEVLTEIFLSKVEERDFILSKIKGAWTMYESGMTVLAISVCKEILPRAPKNVFLLDSLGFFLLRSQKYEEAIAHLTQAIEIDHDFADAHNNLGYAYLMTNDLEKGNHHLKIAFSLDNKNALIERNLGIYQASIGKIEEALKHFERALNLDPDVDQIHYFIGLAHLEDGNVTAAKDAFQKAEREGDTEAAEMLKNLNHE